jgi:hypothetical protein
MEQTTHASKSAVMIAVIAGKISTVVGWIFAVFFLLGLLGAAAGGVGYVIFCLVCIALGVLLIVYGKKTKDRIRRFRKYITIITIQNQTAVDQIANIVQMPVNFILADIKKMIDKKYFVGAYIDQTTNSIAFHGKAVTAANNEINEDAAPNREMQIVACKSCGAQNHIVKGTVGECEYCGSPLSYN